MAIAFIDLQAQRRRIADRIDRAFAGVLEHGRFIMGPEVAAFERQLADYGQARHALSCANGTDALALPLMAWGLKRGDAVFCPSFTFAATAEVVPWLGATPVFVDVDPDTYNIVPAKLADAIEAVKAAGTLTPRAIIAVDLFGQPADYPAIAEIARAHGLKLIADTAQGFGCTLHGRHPLSWADIATTSFFPAKPLGCYGDGGAVLTNDDELADVITSLRNHGQGADRYDNVRIGMNSRLDSLQAAVLIEKLAVFDEEIAARNRIAERYAAGLAGAVERTPAVIEGGVSVWAQYTIEHRDRDGLAAHLKEAGVPTAVYYAKPLHLQTAYRDYPRGAGGLPVTEDIAGRVISLPMHPYLDAPTQDQIIDAVRAFAR
ncbi:MAG: DegT/DnrJ/EryC1/StrS family aminotransferase [Caulobacterales bacterium]|nr:DegT/DnrJ/EryC1/StrS family aminotransferase [Caulobacterales bacterium]